MIFRKINLISYPIFCLLLFFLSGCGVGKSTVMTNDSKTKDVHLIAVLPVQNGTSDQQAAAMLRDKVLNALYFKGYPRIPAQLIDEKLSVQQQKENPEDKVEYSRVLGEQMHVDAVLYCDLKESRTTRYLFYSPMSVAAVFELRSAKTGQLLWRNSYSSIRRNYGISKNSLRLKISQDYESAIQELVDKGIESLPESPDILG